MNRLREVRSHQRMSQMDLARHAGVSRQMISLIEVGRVRPTARMEHNLSELLGVPPSVLFPRVDEEDP